MAPEVAGEVRLVVEADADGDGCNRHAVEELAASFIDAPADEIAVGRQPVLPGEAANQVRRGSVSTTGSFRSVDLASREKRTRTPGTLGQCEYLPKLGLPILIYAGDAVAIRRAFDRARERGLAVSVYTDALFTTRNDVDNRAAVATVPTDELVIAGFAVAGEARQVDKAFDKLKLHP